MRANHETSALTMRPFLRSVPRINPTASDDPTNSPHVQNSSLAGITQSGTLRALRTDIEQSALFPVVGGGCITRARKIPITDRSASITLPAPTAIANLDKPNPTRVEAQHHQ